MSLLNVHPIAVFTASVWAPPRARAHAPRLPLREEPAPQPVEPVKAAPPAPAAPAAPAR